ncbi:RDD family protein [Bacillus sp. B-jedd]|uniref:RDD family protein n=1 Tax=Bacillus sp. B-jedd TaxID=1476857 RepID=UPI000515544E|nr:RDD family protein [Bacillus sp. B-jedd]CEG27403.1 RDD family protein [Bacillus sp. B-jedd]
MYCPNCHTLNEEDARFCSKCGEYLEKKDPEVCPDCGATRKSGEAFCTSCGFKFSEPSTEQISSPPTPVQQQTDYAIPEQQVVTSANTPQFGSPGYTIYSNEQVKFAGFGLRFVALILDSIILSIAGGIIGAIFMISEGELGSTLLSFVIGLAYKAGLEGSSKQATLGKMVLGIKVIGPDGGRISYGRAIGRYFANFLSAITLFIGYLMAAFTKEKRALHDFVAGTYVVKVNK